MVKEMVLKKSPKVVAREIEGEVILMPLYKSADDMSYIYTLNATAGRFWELLDGKRSVAAIKDRLLKEYDVEEKKLKKEIDELVQDLKSIKAVA